MNAPADLPESERGPGAPKGNVNGLKQRHFAEALKVALFANDRKKLRAIADKAISLAMKGDTTMIKEVLDRIDGKVPAGVELTGAGGGDLVIRDANTSIGVARRIAFALAQGAIAKARGLPEAAGAKDGEIGGPSVSPTKA